MIFALMLSGAAVCADAGVLEIDSATLEKQLASMNADEQKQLLKKHLLADEELQKLGVTEKDVDKELEVPESDWDDDDTDGDSDEDSDEDSDGSDDSDDSGDDSDSDLSETDAS